MRTDGNRRAFAPAHPTADDDWPEPIEIINEAGASPVVLLCEHASNFIPPRYHGLGLAQDDLCRHIAWDIGAAAVTRALSRALDAPAFLATASRLLLDLNRPCESPTAMPERSEDTDVPGNRDLTTAERALRIERLFTPFHDRIAAHLNARRKAGRTTQIVTIHSFTPVFHGEARPWHAGVLFGAAETFGHAMIAALCRDDSLIVGENRPYDIDRASDWSVPVHGDDRGLAAVLIEIRQDLLADDAGVAEWASRLAGAIPAAVSAL